MIKKHIEKLKTRSHAEKSNTAFLISLVLTSIITAIWFVTIFTHPTEYFQPQESKEQNLANSGSLFDSLKEGLK